MFYCKELQKFAHRGLVDNISLWAKLRQTLEPKVVDLTNPVDGKQGLR